VYEAQYSLSFQIESVAARGGQERFDILSQCIRRQGI
jgi:hypothetical protein